MSYGGPPDPFSAITNKNGKSGLGTRLGIVIDGVVKVRYIRYGKDFDEHRKQEDNVNLECDDSSVEKTPPFCASLSCQQFRSSDCTRNSRLE